MRCTPLCLFSRYGLCVFPLLRLLLCLTVPDFFHCNAVSGRISEKFGDFQSDRQRGRNPVRLLQQRKIHAIKNCGYSLYRDCAAAFRRRGKYRRLDHHLRQPAKHQPLTIHDFLYSFHYSDDFSPCCRATLLQTFPKTDRTVSLLERLPTVLPCLFCY